MEEGDERAEDEGEGEEDGETAEETTVSEPGKRKNKCV